MNILFVDDHTIFREGVISYLKSDRPDYTVLEAAEIATARRLLTTREPDLLITDLSFPDNDGFALVTEAAERVPAVPVVVLSMRDTTHDIQYAFSCGARAYVTKSSGFQALTRAIQAVLSGNYYVDDVALQRVITALVSVETQLRGCRENQDAIDQLSEREREVFVQLANGCSVEEVAGILFISPKTVENHRTRIYRKLKVGDRLELHRFARENGLL